MQTFGMQRDFVAGDIATGTRNGWSGARRCDRSTANFHSMRKYPLGGIRRHAEGHARRLRFIEEAQKLGFNLNEVGELLSLEDGLHCREVEAIAGHELATVRARLAQLGRIETVLAVLVGNCASATEANCVARRFHRSKAEWQLYVRSWYVRCSRC